MRIFLVVGMPAVLAYPIGLAYGHAPLAGIAPAYSVKSFREIRRLHTGE